MRATSRGKRVYVPWRYWGLEEGETYRMAVIPASPPPNYLPYSCDVTIRLNGDTCALTVPATFRDIRKGDEVVVWVGRPEDYYDESLPYGRGRNQAERQEDLERAERFLH